MLRSLYSAVSGMQAHQTKLDVIGNNIANVNTYGFKSSRARFQDVFYQTLQSATGGDNNRGGTNASQVGYGSQLAGIDLNMGRSALQSTGRPLDVAITGEGFFQVMDADGNKFYTRAGNLMLDANSGNLVDANGYTVLGVSGDPLGQDAASDKIHLNIPSRNSNTASKTETINGIQFSITSQNASEDANVSLSFVLDKSLPDGADVVVNASDIKTSSVTIRVNPNAVFTSLADFNSKVNTAITAGNGGKAHPAGDFTIAAKPAENIFKTSLTGSQLLGDDFKVVPGKFEFVSSTDQQNGIFGGIKLSGTSTEPKFTGTGDVDFEATFKEATGSDPAAWVIKATVGGRTFVGEINENSTNANKMWLKESPVAAGEEAGQYLEVSHPGYTAIEDYYKNAPAGEITQDPAGGGKKIGFVAKTDVATVTAAADSTNVGLQSKNFTLTGGTGGGSMNLSEASVVILANGIIEATHPDQGKIQIGRVDLVSFENPYGLEEIGNSYFAETANSGEAKACIAGESGTGALKTSALEMSNVDISSEFSDMIVTQRGFQANSRIITVSDSILEELVNLKR